MHSSVHGRGIWHVLIPSPPTLPRWHWPGRLLSLVRPPVSPSPVLISVLVLTAIALVAAGPLMRLLGDKVEAVITRLLGVLLSALAAQYVIDGLRGSFFS